MAFSPPVVVWLKEACKAGSQALQDPPWLHPWVTFQSAIHGEEELEILIVVTTNKRKHGNNV